MRSQQHTAHTHTTDLKPSIAPIEAPSSALPGVRQCRGASSSLQEQGAATDGAKAPSFVPAQLTSSRERVTTDDAKAPCHRRALRHRIAETVCGGSCEDRWICGGGCQNSHWICRDKIDN